MSRWWNRARSLLRIALPWFPAPLVVFCAVALTVRFTTRDANVPSALFYYVGQPLVIGVCLLFAAAIWWSAHRRSLALLTVVIGLACCGWWRQTSFAPDHEVFSPRVATARLMLWNLNGAWLGTRALGKIIGAQKPDVAGLLETWMPDPLIEEVIQASGIPYHFATVGVEYGMILLVRGDIRDVRTETIARRTQLLAARVTLDAGSAYVALVDVPSYPLRSRSEPLNAIGRVARELRDEQLILFGDFNTPPDSMYFASLRGELRNAFETAGEGYAPTWPMPFPVLTLDQVWLGPAWSAQRCRAHTTLFSDHRYLVCDAAPAPKVALTPDALQSATPSTPSSARAAPIFDENRESPWSPLYPDNSRRYSTGDTP